MNPFYFFVRTVFIPILRVFNRLEVRGVEHVPEEGACLIAANHASYLDPFVLGAACPRKIHFMVVRDQFEKWFSRWFFWGMDAFPVNQSGWDGEALKEALRRLERGDVVGIYPEGTRSADGVLTELKAGVALLARRADVAVVPAGLVGTARSFPRGSAIPRPTKVCVRFGPPIRYFVAEGERDRDAAARFLEALRVAIQELMLEDAGAGPDRTAAETGAAP